MSSTANDILSALGFDTKSSRKALRDKTFISDFFEWMLVKDPKTRNLDLWSAIEDTEVDLNGLFMGISRRQTSRMRDGLDPEDLEDMVQDALMHTVTKATVSKWDGRDPINYFVAIFRKKLLTEVQSWLRVKKQEQQMDADGVMDSLIDDQDIYVNKEDPLDNYVQLNQLIKGLEKHFDTKSRLQREWLYDLLQWTIEGHPLKEIAKRWGDSPATVSRRMKIMGGYIVEYANKTDNALLKVLLEKYIVGRRKYASMDDLDAWQELFHDYKRKITALHKGVRKANYSPVRTENGKKIKQISISRVYDPHNEELYGNNTSYSSQSEEAIRARRDKAIEECNQFEDVIDLGEGVLAVITSKTGEVVTEQEPDLDEASFIEEPLKDEMDYGLSDEYEVSDEEEEVVEQEILELDGIEEIPDEVDLEPEGKQSLDEDWLFMASDGNGGIDFSALDRDDEF